MKNNKFSNTPPLVENDKVINDPYEKSNIFNTFLASKSSVPEHNDPAPTLEQKEGVSLINSLKQALLKLPKLLEI